MKPSSNSALYRGTLSHIRLKPFRHQFSYRIDSFLFDIDELSKLAQRCRLFSLNKFNLFSFHYRDFGIHKSATPQTPRDYLESTLKERGIEEPLHRATLLCYPRICGYTFNPLAVYYCYNRAEKIFAILCEVTNTFGQRHSYLLDIPDSNEQPVYARSCPKLFYVSPFIGMDAHYHFRLRRPGDTIALAIRETERNEPVLHAVFQGHRRAINDRELLVSFLRLPFMTLQVMAGIHWQALKLFIKGLRISPRPTEPAAKITRIKI